MNKDKINNFLVGTGLYKYIPFSDDECNELATLLCLFMGNMSYGGHVFYKFDAYCPLCKKETVFSLRAADGAGSYTDISQLRDIKRLVIASCARVDSHTITFWLQTSHDGVTKIGQIPPVKEIISSNISRYKKLLGSDLIELQTAIHLHSHGVGIGSFVYLRRIFENLISATYEENKSDIVDADKFLDKRMVEKIKVLELFLPPFITSNCSIYRILSTGIHELDEDECSAFFPVLKESIEMILEQKIKLKEEKEKENLLSKAINSISSKLNKTSN